MMSTDYPSPMDISSETDSDIEEFVMGIITNIAAELAANNEGNVPTEPKVAAEPVEVAYQREESSQHLDDSLRNYYASDSSEGDSFKTDPDVVHLPEEISAFRSTPNQEAARPKRCLSTAESSPELDAAAIQENRRAARNLRRAASEQSDVAQSTGMKNDIKDCCSELLSQINQLKHQLERTDEMAKEDCVRAHRQGQSEARSQVVQLTIIIRHLEERLQDVSADRTEAMQYFSEREKEHSCCVERLSKEIEELKSEAEKKIGERVRSGKKLSLQQYRKLANAEKEGKEIRNAHRMKDAKIRELEQAVWAANYYATKLEDDLRKVRFGQIAKVHSQNTPAEGASQADKMEAGDSKLRQKNRTKSTKELLEATFPLRLQHDAGMYSGISEAMCCARERYYRSDNTDPTLATLDLMKIGESVADPTPAQFIPWHPGNVPYIRGMSREISAAMQRNDDPKELALRHARREELEEMHLSQSIFERSIRSFLDKVPAPDGQTKL